MTRAEASGAARRAYERDRPLRHLPQLVRRAGGVVSQPLRHQGAEHGPGGLGVRFEAREGHRREAGEGVHGAGALLGACGAWWGGGEGGA